MGDIEEEDDNGLKAAENIKDIENNEILKE